MPAHQSPNTEAAVLAATAAAAFAWAYLQAEGLVPDADVLQSTVSDLFSTVTDSLVGDGETVSLVDTAVDVTMGVVGGIGAMLSSTTEQAVDAAATLGAEVRLRNGGCQLSSPCFAFPYLVVMAPFLVAGDGRRERGHARGGGNRRGSRGGGRACGRSGRRARAGAGGHGSVDDDRVAGADQVGPGVHDEVKKRRAAEGHGVAVGRNSFRGTLFVCNFKF